MTFWWLSFESEGKSQGCAIIECDSNSLLDALREAWRKGCNPGGSPTGSVIPPDTLENLRDLAIPFNKVLTVEDMMKMGIIREYQTRK
jgi:hypothetical protein